VQGRRRRLLVDGPGTLWEAFPPKESASGQGNAVSASWSADDGTTLGGTSSTRWNWPWIFYINLPLGRIAGLPYGYVRERNRKKDDHGGLVALDFLTTGGGAFVQDDSSRGGSATTGFESRL